MSSEYYTVEKWGFQLIHMRSTPPIYLLYLSTISGHFTSILSAVPAFHLFTMICSFGEIKLDNSITALLSIHLTQLTLSALKFSISPLFIFLSLVYPLGIYFRFNRTVPQERISRVAKRSCKNYQYRLHIVSPSVTHWAWVRHLLQVLSLGKLIYI